MKCNIAPKASTMAIVPLAAAANDREGTCSQTTLVTTPLHTEVDTETGGNAAWSSFPFADVDGRLRRRRLRNFYRECETVRLFATFLKRTSRLLKTIRVSFVAAA